MKIAAHGPSSGGLAAGTGHTAPTGHWDRLRDVEFIHRMLIPVLIARRGGVPRWELERTGRRALQQLAAASAGLEQGARDRSADLLADWANNLGEDDLVGNLRQGRSASAHRPISAAKRRLRSFYGSLR